MFTAPTGLPATEFKRELEDRLMEECQFKSGMIGDRRSGVVPLRVWEQSRFGVRVGPKVKSKPDQG